MRHPSYVPSKFIGNRPLRRETASARDSFATIYRGWKKGKLENSPKIQLKNNVRGTRDWKSFDGIITSYWILCFFTCTLRTPPRKKRKTYKMDLWRNLVHISYPSLIIFFLYFFFFFFRENSFTNDIFIFILVYILLFCKKESATRCNNINIQLSRFRSVRKLWLVASSIYDILFVELEKEFCLYTKNSLSN